MAYDKVVDSEALDSMLTSIADRVRDKRNLQGASLGSIYHDDIADEISNIRLGVYRNIIIDPEPWVRPDGCPDLDSMEYGKNELYMTFDNTGRIRDSHCSFAIYGTSYKVQIGDDEKSFGDGEVFSIVFSEDDGKYPVIHVLADENPSGFSFLSATIDKKVYAPYEVSLIERIGDFYDFSRNEYDWWGCYYLEREKVARHHCGSNGLNTTYYNCHNLKSLDISVWDSRDWEVTVLDYTFYGCYSLQALDFSNLNTSNWRVTTMNATFYACFSLQSLDFSNIDTSNWAVTNLMATFLNCRSIRTINFSNINTSNWAVTNLQRTFQNCFSLQSLDFSNIDTSNWAVNNISKLFESCESLHTINLSGVNTSMWTINSLARTFLLCHSLEKIDLSNIDTSKWAVTNLSQTFYRCESLQSFDFSNIDTSKWAVTNLSQTFYGCESVKSFDFSNIDTSKWAVTDLSQTFYGCVSVKSFDFSNIDTSKWNVKKAAQLFYSCTALQYLDFSNINTSNWELSDVSSIFYYCRSLKTINFSGIDSSKWTIGNFEDDAFDFCYFLEYFDLSPFDTSKWSLTKLPSIGMHGCKKVDISTIDISKITDVSTFYSIFGAVDEVAVGENNYGKFAPASSYTLRVKANKFTIKGIVELSKMLGAVSSTCYFNIGSTMSNMLTTEEKEAITAKGWTIT